MCFFRKTVFTICAHYTVELVECNKFHKNPDKTGRHTCNAPLCQHSQALSIILGFCKTCEAAYTGLDVSGLNATKILWNFWCFKAAQKWNYAVDPSRVPVSALTSPVKMLCKSWFGYVRTYKEVSMDMIMALSMQSIVNALSEQVTTRSFDLCQVEHCKDVHRIAMGMREATISWARGLECPQEIFKSYGVHFGLTYLGPEEANLAAFKRRSHETLASVQPSQQCHASQRSPSSQVFSEDFPMRVPKRNAACQTKHLNAKLRMEIVLQEREEMFKKLEAEHKRRVWELQAQVDLDDAGISAGTSRTSVYNATIAPSSFACCGSTFHPKAPKTPSPRESPLSGSSGGLFEGFSGAWEHKPFGHVQGDNDFELCESPCTNKTLHLQESSYADLVGEVDEFLFERRWARRSQYGEIIDPQEVSGGSCRVRRLKDEQEQSYQDQEDTIDEHIDFYLDDDSISVSKRVRPLTYVSPKSSPYGSNSSSPQTPSPPGARNADALPAIPPVSPLHFAELSFMADTAERSHRSSDRIGEQCDVSCPEHFVKAMEPASEGARGRDTFGPASRESSGVAPLLVPEIRAVAPPRPARGPVLCTTQDAERQNGCQWHEAGTFQEIGLKPGERVNSPEPEPEQF